MNGHSGDAVPSTGAIELVDRVPDQDRDGQREAAVADGAREPDADQAPFRAPEPEETPRSRQERIVGGSTDGPCTLAG